MVGMVVWIVWSAGAFFALWGLGLMPRTHPDSYAAALLCVLSGLVVGGWVNQWIRDRFPNVDRWNT